MTSDEPFSIWGGKLFSSIYHCTLWQPQIHKHSYIQYIEFYIAINISPLDECAGFFVHAISTYECGVFVSSSRSSTTGEHRHVVPTNNRTIARRYGHTNIKCYARRSWQLCKLRPAKISITQNMQTHAHLHNCARCGSLNMEPIVQIMGIS